MENKKQDTSGKSNMIKRIITGIIMGVIGLACFSAGGWYLFVLIGIFIIAGALELVKIMQHKGFYPFKSIAVAMCILFLFIFKTQRLDIFPLAMTIGTISSFFAVLFNGRQPYIANISGTIFCFVYSFLPCYILLVREIESKYTINFDLLSFKSGFYFLWMIFFAVLFTDVFAYFIGKKFGKRKLAPIVSPKKTVEGAIAGATGAILISLVIGSLINLPWYHSLMLGIVITTFAQLGDLCESLIKRDAGVKDSGQALAGHGGFLDRADSYIFSLPAAYFYLQLFVIDNSKITALIEFLKGFVNGI